MISQLLLKFNRLRMASLSLPGRMEVSVQEHRKLLEAFKARDGEIAENLVTKTAAFGGQQLIQSMAQKEGRPFEGSILQQVGDV